MWMRTDLGFALALMNGMWLDIETLPEEEDRPIHRHPLVPQTLPDTRLLIQERPIDRTSRKQPLYAEADCDTVPQA